MTDRERLVMEALAQVKTWEIRLNFLLGREKKYLHAGERVPEDLAQEITHTRKVVEHRRGMHRRLTELFEAEVLE